MGEPVRPAGDSDHRVDPNRQPIRVPATYTASGMLIKRIEVCLTYRKQRDHTHPV